MEKRFAINNNENIFIVKLCDPHMSLCLCTELVIWDAILPIMTS